MSGEKRSMSREDAGVFFVGLFAALLVDIQLGHQPLWLRLITCVGAGVGAALIAAAGTALWRRHRR